MERQNSIETVQIIHQKNNCNKSTFSIYSLPTINTAATLMLLPQEKFDWNKYGNWRRQQPKWRHATMVLTPVSCYYMTSFSYGGRKVRDVDLTCKCYLSNIMLDSIFYVSRGCAITSFFLVREITTVFLGIKEMDSVALLL